MSRSNRAAVVVVAAVLAAAGSPAALGQFNAVQDARADVYANLYGGETKSESDSGPDDVSAYECANKVPGPGVCETPRFSASVHHRYSDWVNWLYKGTSS